jgi:hypothetical protein
MLFIRKQYSPYCAMVARKIRHSTFEYTVEEPHPCIRYEAITPQGRNEWMGWPDDWGPDAYGYTDFDDYHLALYGA